MRFGFLQNRDNLVETLIAPWLDDRQAMETNGWGKTPVRKPALRLAAIMVVGSAPPRFDESGGATQFQTDATAGQLVADATWELVAGASGAPCPD